MITISSRVSQKNCRRDTLALTGTECLGALGTQETLTYRREMAEEPIEAIEAITKRIMEEIDSGGLPEDLRTLAEARAWLIWPNQPH
jgi:hypothetical protein